MTEMRIYQAADGSWIFWDGETKTTGLTEEEAIAMLTAAQLEINMASKKEQFITAILDQITNLTDLDDLTDVYQHRGYGGAGNDPILQEDLTEAGILLADWNEGLQFLLDVKAVVDANGPVLSKLRVDI